MVIGENILMYIFSGTFVGLASGVLGIGGGIIIVPALLFIFENHTTIPTTLTMQMAAGSSLAVILFTSLASIRAHCRTETILWWVYRRLWVGVTVGTVCGALLASQLSTATLKVMFAAFLLFVAYKMSKQRDAAQHGHFPPLWINHLLSTLIGLSSGLLGIGGGVMMIPYLTYCGIGTRQIVPISLLCTMTVAAIGTLTFMLSGHQQSMPVYSTGYIYWPAVLGIVITSVVFAPLGAKLSYILPVRTLRYGFIVAILLTALGLVL